MFVGFEDLHVTCCPTNLNVNEFAHSIMNNPALSMCMCCLLLFAVNTCDKKIIRKVEHSTYSISEGELSDDFTLHMNVTYTCDEGYSLQNPTKYSSVCEFHTPAPDDQGDGTARAQWRSFYGIVCANGELELQRSILKRFLVFLCSKLMITLIAFPYSVAC